METELEVDIQGGVGVLGTGCYSCCFLSTLHRFTVRAWKLIRFDTCDLQQLQREQVVQYTTWCKTWQFHKKELRGYYMQYNIFF